ncbi:MAG TPA: hypothetical protein VG847_11735 [Chitinophagaceae bacterium]|nr:hypothetical protein [Chitinophagaceae bacterium]
MARSLQRWLSFSFFNLLLVAALGCILRYKIAYSLPLVDQKFLLNAHSHFAFSGWVTQSLMTLMVQYLSEKMLTSQFPKYRRILWLNAISAYGMLFTFPFEGYATASIIFSTASLFAGYLFAFTFWKDLRKAANSSVETKFFKAALFFNILSSLGPYTLAFLMATKSSFQNLYVAAIYFFLHFQYNGWFLFACMGLVAYRLSVNEIAKQKLTVVFYLFASACLPAYFLSALWIPMPEAVYIIVALAAIAQLSGWIIMLSIMKAHFAVFKFYPNSLCRILFLLSGIAYTIKLLLQVASAIPSLSYLTYGFRPIVIGYLHLVLLGVVSLFITTYSIAYQYIYLSGIKKAGVIIFVAGIVINEIFLMIQGIADLSYRAVPYINEELLAAAVILFAGLLLLNFRGIIRNGSAQRLNG